MSRAKPPALPPNSANASSDLVSASSSSGARAGQRSFARVGTRASVAPPGRGPKAGVIGSRRLPLSILPTRWLPAVDRVLDTGELSAPVAIVGAGRAPASVAAAKGGAMWIAPARPRGLWAKAARGRRALPDLVADERRLPIASFSVAALVAFSIAEREDWSERLAEWIRVVRPGGKVALVDDAGTLGGRRARAAELGRRVLCAGLGEIEQRRAARKLVTSGIAPRW